jgi:hypothetical protein
MISTKQVLYDVIDDKDGSVLFQVERSEPLHWDAATCQFHKDDSSWCVWNILNELSGAQLGIMRDVFSDRPNTLAEIEYCMSSPRELVFIYKENTEDFISLKFVRFL